MGGKKNGLADNPLLRSLAKYLDDFAAPIPIPAASI
jgi:hypothetical protein